MIRTISILVLVLAIVFCPDFAHAQQNTTDAALREKAFKLLESAAGQLNNLQSSENRARLGANIADSLWTHDEKRARVLFALVEEDIRAGMANCDLDNSKDQHTLKVFLKLRVETVERIAKYDSELALAFLKATEFTSDNPLPRDIAAFERPHGFETRLAKAAADNNPEVALKFALQSLERGVSEDLLLVLRQLNKKNKEQALTLYKEIVKKLRQANLQDNWETISFATSLIYAFRPPSSNDRTFRELIGLLITGALERGCGNTALLDHNHQQYCELVASALPQLERIDPRAAQLKRWVRPADDVYVSPETIQELYEVYKEGTVDDLLTVAAKYPQQSDDIHESAVRRLAGSGDFEQARKIADRIADPEKKRGLLAQIASLQKRDSPDDKELAEIEARLNHIPNVADRIRTLLGYTARFGRTDRTAALKLLKLASDMVDGMKPGSEQTEAQLALAPTYCFAKSDRGLVIMESLMPKLNELVDAAIKLDGFETRYVRDGEWNMSANGRVGALLTRLSDNAGSFAWCDFDRAASLAAQFERLEIRLMAQVKLAQAILAGPPKSLRNQYVYIP